MAPWIIPALRAVLPHVGTIISAAKPMFTKARTEGASETGNFSHSASVQQQIAELQAAAAQNDAHIRELAAQLQSTVAALQEAALANEAKAERLQRISVISMGISVIAACVSLIVLVAR
jgi:hypothetical protein